MMQVFGVLETETKEQFQRVTCGFLTCKGHISVTGLTTAKFWCIACVKKLLPLKTKFVSAQSHFNFQI